MLRETASQPPPSPSPPPPPPLSPTPSSTFYPFPRLAPELRFMIWNAAEDSIPGHVIEVCNIPDHYDDHETAISFEWRAVACGCEKRCLEPPLSRVNRESREVSLKRRSKCFGRWVNWEKDIIFIGDRVGHLHNTGFLQALEKQGCREKLRHLAVDYECWDHTVKYPCPRGDSCSCDSVAIISQLPLLQQLTFTKYSGAWRDGTETKPQDPNYCMNAYRVYDNDHPDIEDIRRSKHEGFCRWLSQIGHEENNALHPPTLPAEKNDRWRCGAEDIEKFHEGMLSSYKPVESLHDERKYGLNNNCGIALVAYDKIEGVYWCEFDDEDDVDTLQDDMRKKFDRFKIASGDESPGDPKSTTWTPPALNYAILRRTAPSCSTSDWEGLERDWMTFDEAYWAAKFTENYKKRDKSKDYPAGQHHHTFEEVCVAADMLIIRDQ
ncbi:hypothetical protein DSL72_003420 [Monilinia vaccinii-corymbosi]|uniref:2EXR domain-containing protein n=1 Tax=Monilinia vaccinii-corymbosi TaxID=61207 RepID=A0A8A3NZN0_9HELO|nr:hypothetical protein DSL72_003420 [Monilinia vaccinii-corymbosi]